MTDIGRFDKVINSLHKAMSERIDRTATALRTEKAPGTKQVPDQEQVKQYLQMRNNDQAWQQIIQQHGLMGALTYRKEMEKKAQKFHEKMTRDIQSQAIPGETVEFPPYSPSPMPPSILSAIQSMNQAGQQPPEGGAPPPNAAQ